MYYNHTGKNASDCLDLKTSDCQVEGIFNDCGHKFNSSSQIISAGALDDSGWTVQTCSEFPMPMGDDPAQSCFTWDNWDKDAFTTMC